MTTVSTVNNTCTKSGNTFAGWSCNGNTVVAGETFTIDANTTCTAQWNECPACATTNASCSVTDVVNNVCVYTTSCNPGYGNIQNDGEYNASCTVNTYDITYDLSCLTSDNNCATNYAGAPTTYTYGVGGVINGIPVRSGYIFMGWCTDGGLESCAMSQTIPDDAIGDKTFYAKWIDENSEIYSVTYSCGVGSGNAPTDGNRYSYDATVTTVTNANNTCVAPANKTFVNWSCGENTVIAGNTFTINTDTTCTAQYVDAYTVTYACGSGAGGTAPIDLTDYIYGANVTTVTVLDNTCTKTNNIFTGWSCNGNDVVAGDTFTINVDTICTAQWNECTACNAINASCELSIANNVCTYITSCNEHYGNIQNNGAYNVSCSLNTYDCAPGYYLQANATECTQCPKDHYCPGNIYSFNATTDQGINHCAGDLRAPQGMARATQCGRRMNFTLDDGIYLYMHGEKKSPVAVNIDINQDGTPEFFGNMTKIRVPMNIDFANKPNHNKWVIELYDDFVNSAGMTIEQGTYYVYDDTINPANYFDVADLTVTYSCGTGGGTPPIDANLYADGATVTTLDNTCTKDGGVFVGWLCGSQQIRAGKTFYIGSNTTCTAQWN